MAEAMPSQVAFRQHEFHPPQPTISLSETSLQPPSCSTSRSQTPQIKDEPGDEKKPTKKRKSWGQELPTPKTNLPPRKRAKTDDEKEQRRIERVLRNRAAAQSSRERKRQEVEKLEGEKSLIERQNQFLKDRLLAVEHEKFLLSQKVAKMSAQLSGLSDGSVPSCPASPEPEPAAFDHIRIKQEIDEGAFSFSTPQTFSSPSTMTYSPSLSPSQPSLSFDDESLATSPDVTQHPAVSVHGSATPKPITSAYGSRNCDPIIFGDSDTTDDHSSGLGFDSLFAADDTFVHDFHQPKDGGFPPLMVSEVDFALNSNTADFAFDSMVDLDAAEPAATTTDHDELPSLFGTHTDNAGGSDQVHGVAQSVPQQPSLGASA